jgi:curli production assembly/transport component CsgF
MVFWFLLGFLCAPVSLSAQELVFNFIDPSFTGGNFYNASWLLQQAQTQNSFTAKTTSTAASAFDRDVLEDFTESLNRQILSRLSRDIIGDMFGEDGLKEGQYTVGDYEIEVTETIEGVQVLIRDTGKGNETSILVPYF